MKRLVLIGVLIFSFFYAKAQGKGETIYLKNGSIISGVIIEQIPNESFKIQTRDGNIFVFQITDIAKITKEQAYTPTYRASNEYYSFTPGYKGFVDLGYTFGTGDYGYDRIEFSTSYGYQFNPYFYLGAGVGLNYFNTPEVFSVPVFVNPRLSYPIKNSSISPFLDLKIGYTFSKDVKGFYLSPSVGTRFDIGRNKAINFSLGYVLQSVEYTFYSYYYDYIYSERKNCGGISLKLGLEF